MLGQSISLALISVAGLTHGLPTDKRQELGEGGWSDLSPDPPSLGLGSGDIVVPGFDGGSSIEFPGGETEVGGPFSSVNPKRRSVKLPAGLVFEECSQIDLAGVEAAYSTLLTAYGSSPGATEFAAMQPLHNILQGCGRDILKTRDGFTPIKAGFNALKQRSSLVVPTEQTPVDVTPLKQIYADLEAVLGSEPTSLTDFITMDSILTTIEMNSVDAAKEKRSSTLTPGKRAAAAACSPAKINALRLALASIVASYDGETPPMAVYLIAENLITSLQDCGLTIDLGDAFGIGDPVTGGIEPDPTVPGGAMVPEIPVEGGSLVPDPTETGGSIVPDPIVTVTLTPGEIIEGGEMVADPVATEVSTLNPGKRSDVEFGFGKPVVGPIEPDIPSGTYFGVGKKDKRTGPVFSIGKPIVGPIIPDVPIGTSFGVGKKDKRTGPVFSIGKPIVGPIIPDVPIGTSFGVGKKDKAKRDYPDPIFWIGKPIKVGELVPDIPYHPPRDVEKRACQEPIIQALITLEEMYGRACDGGLAPSILMAQQSLVMILFRECGMVWDNWELVELEGGFIELGPVYSSGVNPSD